MSVTPLGSFVSHQAHRALLAALLVVVPVASCGDPAPKPKPPTPVISVPPPPAVNLDAKSASPPPAPQLGPTSGPTDDSSRVEIAGLAMTKPVTWIWQRPTMQFRTLQYSVPASGGATPAAELIYSVFPAGDGGPIQPNIDRWAAQFKSDGSEPAKPLEQSTREISGLRVTRVDLKGSYNGMGAAAPRSGWAQLGVIVQAPNATVYIRLLGPEETVEGARRDFDAMIDGLRTADATSEPSRTGD